MSFEVVITMFVIEMEGKTIRKNVNNARTRRELLIQRIK